MILWREPRWGSEHFSQAKVLYLHTHTNKHIYIGTLNTTSDFLCTVLLRAWLSRARARMPCTFCRCNFLHVHLASKSHDACAQTRAYSARIIPANILRHQTPWTNELARTRSTTKKNAPPRAGRVANKRARARARRFATTTHTHTHTYDEASSSRLCVAFSATRTLQYTMRKCAGLLACTYMSGCLTCPHARIRRALACFGIHVCVYVCCVCLCAERVFFVHIYRWRSRFQPASSSSLVSSAAAAAFAVADCFCAAFPFAYALCSALAGRAHTLTSARCALNRMRSCCTCAW